MEDTAPTPIHDNQTAEKLLFLLSALSALLATTFFAILIWEASPYRNGLSDILVPISLVICFLAFPFIAVFSYRLYLKCRDTFSKSLRIVVIAWQGLLFLIWCGANLLFLVTIIA